jgi:hypothetical protein
MIRTGTICAALAFSASLVAAPPQGGRAPASPPAETSVTINGKAITIKYSAPSVRGRKIFGDGGLLSKEKNYPVWRAGANEATALHTDADLNINGLNVPKGDYTLFVLVEPEPWQLIVSKETGEWGLAYKPQNDLGRVKMTMSKPPSPVEKFKITLTHTGGNKGELKMEWADKAATVPFTVK